MKIPCICEAGWHSFTANEMVEIIGAFQRGELSRTRMLKGETAGIYPLCLANADFDASKAGRFTGACDVQMSDGTACKMPRGHREGRHGEKPVTARVRRYGKRAA